MGLPSLVFGLNDGRSYGQDLDELLIGHGRNLQIFSGDSVQNQLLEMALKNRIDVFLEYEGVVNNYYDVTAVDSKLAKFDIEEAQGFTPFYLLCSRTEQGKKFIEEIDQLLEKLSREPFWLKMQLTAADIKESKRAQFVAAYNRFYKTTFSEKSVGFSE